MTDQSRRESLVEKLRFLVVGGFNTAMGFGIFSLLQFVAGDVLSEVGVLLVSHMIASTVAFILHRRVTFKVEGNLLKDYLRFQTVFIVPIGINLVVLPFLVRVMGVNVYLAQAVISVVTVTVSYFGHKYFSFRRSPKSQ